MPSSTTRGRYLPATLAPSDLWPNSPSSLSHKATLLGALRGPFLLLEFGSAVVSARPALREVGERLALLLQHHHQNPAVGVVSAAGGVFGSLHWIGGQVVRKALHLARGLQGLADIVAL